MIDLFIIAIYYHVLFSNCLVTICWLLNNWTMSDESKRYYFISSTFNILLFAQLYMLELSLLSIIRNVVIWWWHWILHDDIMRFSGITFLLKNSLYLRTHKHFPFAIDFKWNGIFFLLSKTAFHYLNKNDWMCGILAQVIL